MGRYYDYIQELSVAQNDLDNKNQAADDATDDAAMLIQGRLRHVNTFTLKELKKELKSFNAITGEWK